MWYRITVEGIALHVKCSLSAISNQRESEGKTSGLSLSGLQFQPLSSTLRALRRVGDMAEVYDVAVVGGGAMGAWTAVELGKRQKRTILLEQFECGHEKGSSHGDGRIYRKGYKELRYIEMMTASLPLWLELQDFAKETLLYETGLALLGSVDENDASNLCTFIEAYVEKGVKYEILTPEETTKRFPQFRLPPEWRCVHSPEGGVILASRSVKALWEYARALGVELVECFNVNRIEKNAGVIILTSKDGRKVCANRLVLAPGAWLTKLCDEFFGVKISTRVTAETVSYYRCKEGDDVDHSPKTMPVYYTLDPDSLNSYGFYGTPDVGRGVKASAHYLGFEITNIEQRPLAAGGEGGSDGLITTSVEEEEAAEEATLKQLRKNDDFVKMILPHLEDAAETKSSCLYTSTPDHDFIISYVKGWDRSVVIAGGGSGHAFKMAPAIGACAAALALNEDTPIDVRPFDLERLEGVSYHQNNAKMR